MNNEKKKLSKSTTEESLLEKRDKSQMKRILELYMCLTQSTQECPSKIELVNLPFLPFGSRDQTQGFMNAKVSTLPLSYSTESSL